MDTHMERSELSLKLETISAEVLDEQLDLLLES
jgi:hypothetical protein